MGYIYPFLHNFDVESMCYLLAYQYHYCRKRPDRCKLGPYASCLRHCQLIAPYKLAIIQSTATLLNPSIADPGTSVRSTLAYAGQATRERRTLTSINLLKANEPNGQLLPQPLRWLLSNFLLGEQRHDRCEQFTTLQSVLVITLTLTEL